MDTTQLVSQRNNEDKGNVKDLITVGERELKDVRLKAGYRGVRAENEEWNSEVHETKGSEKNGHWINIHRARLPPGIEITPVLGRPPT